VGDFQAFLHVALHGEKRWYLDDRSRRPELLDLGGRIAEEFLAGEIRIESHGWP